MTLAAIWKWNVRRSPLARTIRPHRLAARVLKAASLPANVTARIDAIVRATRLWPDERAEVARELSAHAHDALETGVAEEVALAGLGDPPVVARLIRRAMKRKRPGLYHARVWTLRSLGALAVVGLVLYGALALRFYRSAPTIDTNYLAELNAPNDAFGEDRAFPVYAAAYTDWSRIRREVEGAMTEDETTEFGRLLFRLPAEHPRHPRIAAAVRSLRPALDDVIRVSQHPITGYVYSDRMQTDPDDPDAIGMPLPPSSDPGAQTGLVTVPLSHLNPVRTLAKLLAFDADLAAREGDGERVEAALRAMLGLSRQLSREPFLITALVSASIHDLACDEIAHHLEEPSSLDDRALVSLAHALSSARRDELGLDGEAYMLRDFLQRHYTDDGAGNGHLTASGFEMLGQLKTFERNPEPELPLVRSIASPLLLLTAPSRQAEQARFERLVTGANDAWRRGPSALPELSALLEDTVEDPLDLSPASLFAAPYANPLSRFFESNAIGDATAVRLATEVFRRKHGALPASLDELVPRLLPTIPEDPFDPGQPIKYRIDGDSPVIYFAGADGDDDHGRLPDPTQDNTAGNVRSLTARFGGNQTADGDWVIDGKSTKRRE